MVPLSGEYPVSTQSTNETLNCGLNENNLGEINPPNYYHSNLLVYRCESNLKYYGGLSWNILKLFRGNETHKRLLLF
jgi:hypothetical protein